MVEIELSPIHALRTGLCEDPSGEAAGLLARVAQADAAALVELHGLWSPILLGIAGQILGDRREAEKVVQESFVHLWQRAAGYDAHQMPPFVWAFSVMQRYCIERLRSRRRGPRAVAHLGPIHPPSPQEKPDHSRVLAADDLRRVRAALDQLTPEERHALVAAVFLQYSHVQISHTQEPPLSVVKNHLRQALTKTRNCLSRYEL